MKSSAFRKKTALDFTYFIGSNKRNLLKKLYIPFFSFGGAYAAYMYISCPYSW
jgi:hypothetical protein